LKVLIACEYSGVVREAFKTRGHDAWSCDIIDTEIPGQHFTRDVLNIINAEWWDLMIAHPPCTHLSSSGARWWKEKKDKSELALQFVQLLMNAPIDKICIENPIGMVNTRIRKPDQIVQPYQFGHSVSKSTCLWLKNLPPLQTTNIVEPEWQYLKNGKRIDKWYSNNKKDRSRTFPGIANAMANQWG
jgi:site-specific DNA-cytosine methylase